MTTSVTNPLEGVHLTKSHIMIMFQGMMKSIETFLRINSNDSSSLTMLKRGFPRCVEMVVFLDAPSVFLQELGISVMGIAIDALQLISNSMESVISFTVLQTRVLDALCRLKATPSMNGSDAIRQVATNHEYPSSRFEALHLIHKSSPRLFEGLRVYRCAQDRDPEALA